MNPADLRAEVARTAAAWGAARENEAAARTAHVTAWAAAEEADAYGHWTAAELDAPPASRAGLHAL